MDKCPEIATKGDAEESLDYCNLDDLVCNLVRGADCYIWERIKEEE